MKSFIFPTVILLLLGACGKESATEATPGERESPAVLTVVATEISAAERKLFDAFSRTTGVELRVRPVLPAASQSLLSEQVADADLIWTSDIPMLERAKQREALLPLTSDSLRRHIPADARDNQDQWFGFMKSVWLLATHQGANQVPECYETLADSTWIQRVLLTDSSFTDYRPLLAVLIAQHGQAQGYRWAKQVQKNAVPQFIPDLETLLSTLQTHPDWVALLQSHRLAEHLTHQKAGFLELTFPNQGYGGTIPQLRAGAVLRSTRHPEIAQQFLEFFISESSQRHLTTEGYWYPVRADTPPAALLRDWGEFEVRVMDWKELGVYQKKAHEVMESVRTFRQIDAQGTKGL